MRKPKATKVKAVGRGPAVVKVHGGRKRNTPLYPRLLRLRHVHPNGWQRALLGEGAIAAALLLMAADLATAWTLLVLPLAVAVVVKANDIVAGVLVKARPAAVDEAADSVALAGPGLDATSPDATSPDGASPDSATAPAPEGSALSEEREAVRP